jgi:hypothetical protein
MKQEHLSHWQIEELIIDGPTAIGGSKTDRRSDGAWRHIESCALCASNKERLESQLSLFRNSAVLSASLADRHVAISLPRHSWPLWTLTSAAKWGLALVLLLAAFLPILLQQQHGVQQKAEHRTADQIASDNLFLQQVDEKIADSVPQPLEPLSDLAADESNSLVKANR